MTIPHLFKKRCPKTREKGKKLRKLLIILNIFSLSLFIFLPFGTIKVIGGADGPTSMNISPIIIIIPFIFIITLILNLYWLIKKS
jgi:hypothetical protein